MGSRAAFKSAGGGNFTFVENGETYRTIGGFDNLRVLIKDKGSRIFSHRKQNLRCRSKRSTKTSCVLRRETQASSFNRFNASAPWSSTAQTFVPGSFGQRNSNLNGRTTFGRQSKEGVQFKMRINEYADMNQFIYEYDRGRRPSDETHERRFMGIEFLHDGVYYRMCREPLPDDIKPGYYQVYIMHCEKRGYPGADEFETVGIFNDIYDLLDNCIIGGKFFRDVIMDDNTEILGKD